MKKQIEKWPILALVFVTLWLRLANLGYSDYQGDEIKALSAKGENLLNFLLQQRKGPTEFVVAYLIKLVHPTLTNQFLTRLPYGLAAILAIFFFFQMVRLHYGNRTALYSALLFSINGLFVGLTRIIQYQGFVLLFSCLALYAFSLAVYNSRWKTNGIYAGMLFWALALFTHFDGIFITPFALYLLYRWYRNYPDISTALKLRHLILPGAVCVLLLASFYLPFFASSSDMKWDYWWKRISGDRSDAALLSSSIVTFNLYNPLQTIFIYTGLGLLSLRWIRDAFPVWLWAAFPWIIFEGAVNEPGTHIYTYLLPAMILAALGIRTVEETVTKILKQPYGTRINLVLCVSLFSFLFSISHFIFIDHTPEYPWEARRILFWKVEKPAGPYKLKVFGFPYQRHWEEISEFVTSSQNNGYYWTNENLSISEYYIPYSVDSDKAGFHIHIYHPQSFKDGLTNDKVRNWITHHLPVKIFTNGQKVVAEVYLMPTGNINEVKGAGD